MKNLNNLRLFLVLWLAGIFNKKEDGQSPVTPTESLASNKKEDASDFRMPEQKIVFALNNRDGNALKKYYTAKWWLGIVVVLYTITVRKTRYGTSFLMMSLGHEKIIGCLSPPDTHGEILLWAADIKTKCTGNTHVTVPAALLLQLGGNITTITSAKGSLWIDAYNDLIDTLNEILELFQTAMDADHEHAVTICESGGFHVKGAGGKDNQVFSSKKGVAIGSVDLILVTGPKGCCYDIKLHTGPANDSPFDRQQPADKTHYTLQTVLASRSLAYVSFDTIKDNVVVATSIVYEVEVR